MIEDKNYLLTPKEAASIIKSSVASMNSLRSQGKLNLPYVKFNSRIRYKLSDIQKWIDDNRVTPCNKRDDDVQD